MKKFLPLIIISIFFACASQNSNQIEHLSGICSTEAYYSNESFITKNTVQKTFQTNQLDFWIFGLNNSEFDQNMKQFRKMIQGISRYLKKRDLLFDFYPIFNARVKQNNDTDQQYIFFPESESRLFPQNLPLIFRDNGASFLFNTLTINYNGQINYFFDSYIRLLDKGFILGAAASAEIFGPEWIIHNAPRMKVIVKQKNQQELKEALKKRRTYITFEPNTEINFQINQFTIGDIINDYSSQLNFNYQIKNSDQKKIGKVEIITNNNKILHRRENIDASQITLSGQIPAPQTFSYIYLKIYFENSSLAFTTPIWLIKNKKFLVHNWHYHFSRSSDYNDKLDLRFDIENISNKKIHNAKLLITSSTGKQYLYDEFDLKIRETRQFQRQFLLDTTQDQTFNIKIFKDQCRIEEIIAYQNSRRSKKIAFDTSHNNIFTGNITLLTQYLKQKNYLIDKISDKSVYEKTDQLQKYDLLIITVPDGFHEADKTLHIYYNIHHFVYNGGSLIIAGYNDQKTQISIEFLNQILLTLYCPIKFRTDQSLNVFPIFDQEENYHHPTIPVFTRFNARIIHDKSIKRIYLRNPIEIYASNGVREIPVAKHYAADSIVSYNKTTRLKNRNLYEPEKKSAAALYRFGRGQVVILTGINFSDYDIKHLDNKKWFLNLIDYLLNPEQEQN